MIMLDHPMRLNAKGLWVLKDTPQFIWNIYLDYTLLGWPTNYAIKLGSFENNVYLNNYIAQNVLYNVPK